MCSIEHTSGDGVLTLSTFARQSAAQARTARGSALGRKPEQIGPRDQELHVERVTRDSQWRACLSYIARMLASMLEGTEMP